MPQATRKSERRLNRRYPSHWKVQRFLMADDFSYQPEAVSAPRADVPVRALVYEVIGLLAAAFVFTSAVGGDSRFLTYLACAVLCVFCLRQMPVHRVLSTGLVFLLVGLAKLSLSELLFVGLCIALLRRALSDRKLHAIHALIHLVATESIGVTAAYYTYHWLLPFEVEMLFPTALVASAYVLMLNYATSALMIERPQRHFFRALRNTCKPQLAWFLAATYFAYLVQSAATLSGFEAALVALPLLISLEWGYRKWCDTVSKGKEEIAQLHRNTLETLALAVEARDQTTHMHLRRVRTYALAIGRELKLGEPEMEALNVASLLHDIGKLGIPDHILLKPGPLTSPEWEKMKTHPVIGAEMLSRMRFPDLVAEIVRTHHEKWDGSGYPHGIAGTKIPMGSRILAAVDCLDALASDRPYRPALPLDEAMNVVRNMAGKNFDPAVIAILERRYLELDQLARKSAPAVDTASTPNVERSITNLGNRLQRESIGVGKNDILTPIISARHETQVLLELASDLAQCARLEEVVVVVERSLRKKINFDTIALYIRREEILEPVYFLGAHASLFTPKPFPISIGVSGCVAQTGRPVLNGEVSSESCYFNDSIVLNNLQSALAVPFEARKGTTGVVTLYHLDSNAFRREDLRILEAASLQIGPAVEAALKFQEMEESATTDHLTGVPNARALSVHLARVLENATAEQTSVGLAVCDLDGFKQVNDRFGHLVGDEVLRRVAKGLRSAGRTSDYVARIGGDEFVVVLPGLHSDHSAQIERLRAVAAQAGEAVCGERCLSMSVGVAIFPSDGPDTATLFARADRHMYRMKHEEVKASDGAQTEYAEKEG